jgi:hypothetical protein
MGIRASGHRGIRHQGIRVSGHWGIGALGHWGIGALGILVDGYRLYSLSRFQQRSAFCSSCHMKTPRGIHFIDVCALLYSFHE